MILPYQCCQARHLATSAFVRMHDMTHLSPQPGNMPAHLSYPPRPTWCQQRRLHDRLRLRLPQPRPRRTLASVAGACLCGGQALEGAPAEDGTVGRELATQRRSHALRSLRRRRGRHRVTQTYKQSMGHAGAATTRETPPWRNSKRHMRQADATTHHARGLVVAHPQARGRPTRGSDRGGCDRLARPRRPFYLEHPRRATPRVPPADCVQQPRERPRLTQGQRASPGAGAGGRPQSRPPQLAAEATEQRGVGGCLPCDGEAGSASMGACAVLATASLWLVPRTYPASPCTQRWLATRTKKRTPAWVPRCPCCAWWCGGHPLCCCVGGRGRRGHGSKRGRSPADLRGRVCGWGELLGCRDWTAWVRSCRACAQPPLSQARTRGGPSSAAAPHPRGGEDRRRPRPARRGTAAPRGGQRRHRGWHCGFGGGVATPALRRAPHGTAPVSATPVRQTTTPGGQRQSGISHSDSCTAMALAAMHLRPLSSAPGASMVAEESSPRRPKRPPRHTRHRRPAPPPPPPAPPSAPPRSSPARPLPLPCGRGTRAHCDGRGFARRRLTRHAGPTSTSSSARHLTPGRPPRLSRHPLPSPPAAAECARRRESAMPSTHAALLCRTVALLLLPRPPRPSPRPGHLMWGVRQ